ncbi:hypothetical protein DSUL_100059 [Desulfovibrionales bacterium]
MYVTVSMYSIECIISSQSFIDLQDNNNKPSFIKVNKWQKEKYRLGRLYMTQI